MYEIRADDATDQLLALAPTPDALPEAFEQAADKFHAQLEANGEGATELQLDMHAIDLVDGQVVAWSSVTVSTTPA